MNILTLLTYVFGFVMLLSCLNFIRREQRDPFSKSFSKKIETFIVICCVAGFLTGCLLPAHACIFLPFFVVQSASDIKDKLVGVSLNNMLLLYAVIIYILSTSLSKITGVCIIVGIIFFLSYGFRFYGSGDAKVLAAVFLVTVSDMNFENDLFAFLTFCLVSYGALYLYALFRNHMRKRNGLADEKQIYFYPFLFLGYIIEYLILR